MDVATLTMTAVALEAESVRAAARRLDRSPSAVSAAVARFSAEISVPLITRAGVRSSLTLDARRIRPTVIRAAALAGALVAPDRAVGEAQAAAAASTVSFVALQRFGIVCTQGSIRRASRSLGLGQPQLTQQIRRLERELGRTLLERTPQGVRPTAAGAAVVAALPDLEASLAGLSEQAADRFRAASLAVRLGAIMPLGHQSAIARVVAGLIVRWKAERPRQPLQVTTGSAEQLLAALEENRVDVGLLDSDSLPPGLGARVISRTRLALVGRPDLVTGRTAAEILAAVPLALPSRATGLRQLVDRHLSERGVDLRPDVTEVESIPILASLVRDFGFVSILPLSAIGDDDALQAVPLDPPVEMTLSLVWGASDGARRHAALIAELLAGVIGTGAGRSGSVRDRHEKL